MNRCPKFFESCAARPFPQVAVELKRLHPPGQRMNRHFVFVLARFLGGFGGRDQLRTQFRIGGQAGRRDGDGLSGHLDFIDSGDARDAKWPRPATT